MELRRLRAVARKEWIQLRRDPRSMILAFALPLLLLVFFGYAITWDVDDVPLAIVDRDGTRESRDLVDALVASGRFTAERHADPRTAERALLDGRVTGALLIPPGFARDVAARRSAEVQLLLDGADANAATIALNYAGAVVARHATAASAEALPLELALRIRYNPDLESRHTIVPALIAVIMSIVAALLTALTIAREWERGTMEQLAATPVGRLEVVAGKLLPYLGIGAFDVAVTVLAGRILFVTPFAGSVLLLGGMTLLFLVGALALGIFISAAVRSQVLAIQIAMVVTYLPAVLLSGFLFDIASMPAALQAVTYLIPARYFVIVTRGIFLKGVGLDALWPEAAFMLAYALVALGLAVRSFRKELPA